LEGWLDRLAVAEPVGEAGTIGENPTGAEKERNVLTFAPDGGHGVAAYVDGTKAAVT